MVGRRSVIFTGICAFLSSVARAESLTPRRFSYAPPLGRGPYFMGVYSVPNPVEPNQSRLSGQSNVKPAQEIPSKNCLKGNITARKRTAH